MSSIVGRDVVPRLSTYNDPPASEDPDDAGPAEDVDPGQHEGGGWISGPSNPAPHRGHPHTGGTDQQWVERPAPSGCNPEILIRGIEEWLTEHGYRVNTSGHNNIGRTGLAADILRTYNINPESAPLRQPGHHPNG